MFADDTNLFFRHKDKKALVNMVNVELTKISEWFKLNKLSLNIKKTNYIIFRSKYSKSDINATGNLNIFIDNVKIEQVHETKFLGVIINSNLTWKITSKQYAIKLVKA